jgi:hypothetical protein
MTIPATPDGVVRAFIQAMHDWEVSAWQASRARQNDPSAAPSEAQVKAGLDAVFAEFCTPKDRPFGRAGSYQHPPEYDPERERVVGCTVRERKAEVETEREAVPGGGPWRYTLHLHNGQWLIDGVKWKDATTWKRGVL